MNQQKQFLKFNKNKQAFTLVELIVVVTILAILSTIGFVSYSSYLTWVRDTNRISNVKAISDWLELYRTKFSLPLPEDSVEVKANGTVIAYQWYAWANVLESIEFSNGWKDPKNDNYYSYYLTKNKKYFQLMWFLEEEDNIQVKLFNQTQAVDYSILYPTVYGKKLGILTGEDNTPIQEIVSIITAWKIELDTTNSWTVYNMHINDWKIYSFSWSILNHKLYTLNNPSIYLPPKECPDWFVASWWDSVFNQLWFCVAQYEMSYDETGIQDVNNISRNSRKYYENKMPVSMANRLPITMIKIHEAIEQCQKMWDWYHLITNNERMTVARQIEFNSLNWSSWIIWEWYIPNWVSNETSNSHWCSWKQWDSNWDWMTLWAWITWSDCDWTNKNRLQLYNWQYIYDMSWNVNEHVNWGNTINWTNYNTMNGNVCWTLWVSDWARYSYKNWTLDTSLQCNFRNGYSGQIWPILQSLNAGNGIWKIYSYRVDDTITDRILVYGQDAWDAANAGIFGITLQLDINPIWGGLGFRCAYVK